MMEPLPPTAAATGTLRPVDAHSFSTAGMRSSRPYDDADDDDLTLDDGQAGTEDEFESEDDLPYQYEPSHHHPHHHQQQHHPPPPPSPPRYREHTVYHREYPEHRSHSSHSAHSSHSSYAQHPEASDPRMSYPPQQQPYRYQPYPRPILHGAFSAPAPGYSSRTSPGPGPGPSGPPPPIPDSTDAKLDKMQREIDVLKRQQADAMQASMRMSDQLAEAQAEASRSKASLRVVESRLEDERRRRVEAEMAADEESRIRRSVEDKLRSFQIQGQSPHSQSRTYGGPLKPAARTTQQQQQQQQHNNVHMHHPPSPS